IFGCDDCLAVCPWNKFAQAGHEPAFLPRVELTAPRLVELARLDDAGFRAMFAGTSVKRTGRNRFLRNVLTAIGNAPEPTPELVATARHCLDDASPLVRGAAVWAVGRISGGHFNPAITVGLFTGGRTPAGELLPYILAQLAGAIVAALVLYVIEWKRGLRSRRRICQQRLRRAFAGRLFPGCLPRQR